MNMVLHLDKKKWLCTDTVCVRGRCFLDDRFLEREELLRMVAAIDTEEELLRQLDKMNGLFALIINKPYLHVAVVDKTRMYPLFFSFKNDGWHIADLPAKLCGDKQYRIDRVAENQYLHTGAPFEGKTLVEGIEQVKPAHVLFCEKASRQVKYYSMEITAAEERPDNWEYEQAALRQVLKHVAERLKVSIADRQVVVPLSGGYDSRLIVCMLKQMGCQRILCYTVGPLLSDEQLVAMKVAERLGIPIYRIDYQEEQYITQRYGSDEFNRFCDFVGAYGNFLWLFEYNAIKWLEQKGLLQDDAVFIPGHCGDFIAGSHLTKLFTTKYMSLRRLSKALLLLSFEYAKPFRNTLLRKDLKEKLYPGFAQGRLPHSICQEFIMQNRLAHQINNSARVYDYLGYDVRLPLFDRELLDFFRTLSYRLLIDKKLYVSVLTEQYFVPMQVDFLVAQPLAALYRRQYWRSYVKQYVSRSAYLRYKAADKVDKLGEKFLTADMLADLVKWGICKDEHDYASYNEIMLLWYLQHVKRSL